jgi:hypothetical protein
MILLSRHTTSPSTVLTSSPGAAEAPPSAFLEGDTLWSRAFLWSAEGPPSVFLEGDTLWSRAVLWSAEGHLSSAWFSAFLEAGYP